MPTDNTRLAHTPSPAAAEVDNLWDEAVALPEQICRTKPSITRRHIDGPYLSSLDGRIFWLSPWERLLTKLGIWDAWDIEWRKCPLPPAAKALTRPAPAPAASEDDLLAAACAGKLCDDCPPVGYPTDKTRCTPCPRRTALTSGSDRHG